MPELAERLQQLTPEQRAVVENKLRERKEARRSPTDIRPRNIQGACAMSYSQQVLWLSDQLIAERSTYNVSTGLRIRGHLNIDALRRALNTIVERHSSFRTTFRMIQGEPVQVIGNPQPVPLELLDHPGASDDEIRRIALQTAQHTFDLSRDPLLRGALIRISGQDHLLLLITHHISFDGWSRRNFYREFEQLYAAYAAGQPCPLAPLPIQYSDFALWQRERLEGDAMKAELAWWQHQLSGAPQALELPFDHPRPPTPTFRGARQNATGLTALMQQLKTVRCGQGATLFTTMLATFNVLLYRYTGQDDIVVGTPVLGRPRPELDKLIGLFANTLVLRTDLAGNPTFLELLARVRHAALEAFEHQEVPYDRLVAELVPQRDPSRNPLFQVLFGAGEFPMVLPKIPGLEFSVLKLDRGTSKLDFSFGITAYESQMMDGCEYSTDLFDSSTITRLLAHFRTLMESIVANPERRIRQLNLLPDEERRQILSWSAGPTADHLPATMHALVEAQATRSPHSVAVEQGSERLTYSELNGSANQLARYLRTQGVTENTPVAICCRRSPRAIVGLLGILKAGGTCVPIDPEYPPEHRAFMLRDSGAQILLTQSMLATEDMAAGCQLLRLDAGWDRLAAESPNDLPPVATQDSAAYIIYTSGTVAQPRGVVLSHRGLVNHLRAATPLYGLSPQDRVLQFCSLSFDISIEEIFPALAVGATCVLRPDELLISGREFLTFLSASKVTVLDLPTAFWHAWVRELEESNASLPASLRLVIVGGEQPSATALSAWRRIAPSIRWINTYGPTETSVIASACEPSTQIPDLIPIGAPIANTQLYVLDADLQVVPNGINGELYIGGEGLAIGYHNRPEVTEQCFLPNPFDPGSRLYRTGDRMRRLSDGSIQFLGRVDRQLKVRGFRIEPQQIEAVLALHPSVKQVFLHSTQQAGADSSLVAYIVLQHGETLNAEALRHYLEERLPQYMVPAFFIQLDTLPLTTNGKVDWRALPAPDESELSVDYVPPATPVQELLAEIWSEVLKRDHIGIHDEFFALGGHSLSAAQIVARLDATLGIRLSVRTLFEAPTIARLADHVFTALAAAESSA